MSALRFSVVKDPASAEGALFEGYRLCTSSDAPFVFSDPSSAEELPAYQGLLAMLARAHLPLETLEAQILSYWGAAVSAFQTKGSVAVFTTGRLGQEAAAKLQDMGKTIACFVDNNPAVVGTSVNGIKVVSAKDMAGSDTPIVIATTRFTQSILNQMQRQGALHVLPYSLLSLLWSDRFQVEIPYVDNLADFIAAPQGYLDLFAAMSDPRSREVLDQLIKYRLTHDPAFLIGINDGEENQYHDRGINPMGAGEVFVDVGGFDGDTVQRFLRHSGGSYQHIYLFEPEAALLARAKKNLGDIDRITFLGAGAYSADTTLSFDATGTVNGSVRAEGNIQIPVRRIDGVLAHTPSFIKMDIEGAEVEALKGAAQAIVNHKPKLAIAVYHFGSQMRDVMSEVQAMRPDYRFYLRHYTETGLETVLYAV